QLLPRQVSVGAVGKRPWALSKRADLGRSRRGACRVVHAACRGRRRLATANRRAGPGNDSDAVFAGRRWWALPDPAEGDCRDPGVEVVEVFNLLAQRSQPFL